MYYEPGVGYKPSGTLARVIYPGNLASARVFHFSVWALGEPPATPVDPAKELVRVEAVRLDERKQEVAACHVAIKDIHDKAKADAHAKELADAKAKADAHAKELAKAKADAKAKAAADAKAKAKKKAEEDAETVADDDAYNRAVQQANKTKRDEDNRRRREEIGQAILDGLNQAQPPQQPPPQAIPDGRGGGSRRREPPPPPQATPCDDCPGGKYDNTGQKPGGG